MRVSVPNRGGRHKWSWAKADIHCSWAALSFKRLQTDTVHGHCAAAPQHWPAGATVWREAGGARTGVFPETETGVL